MLDNMVLSYLVEATRVGYEPGRDPDLVLRGERVAAVRLLIWGAVGVGETAVLQSQRTRDAEWREALLRMVAIQLPELPTPEGMDLDRRVEELLHLHADAEDCRILAEAEALNAAAVITFDKRMIHRLERHSAVPLCSPSDYWTELWIPRGTPPAHLPRGDNPLASQLWWRWD
jgi:hypothetical protein